MGSSCTTLKPAQVVKPMKNTPGENSTPFDALTTEERRNSADRKPSKKYRKTPDEGSTYIASMQINSRGNVVTTGDGIEENAKLPSLHFLTEENCDEVPAMLEESLTKKSAHFNKGPLIGKGSCGEVYECLNLKTGELVAVKEIRLCGEATEIQRYTSALKKENVVFKTLNHPNIIRHYETEIIEIKDETHLLINISVEYVSGGSIRTLLNKFRNLDEKVVMIYMRQILEGLLYLHRMGIVHTNLKGTNILIDASGIVKLSDFGSLKLDRFSEENPQDTNKMSRPTRNSIYWSPPEVISHQKYSKASDVWSAGCVVVEMLTGLPPYQGPAGTFEETLNLINNGTVPPLPQYVTDICRDFLQKTFQIKPEDRPTVEDLLDHPFVRDVTPSNSYFESETLLSGLSGKSSNILRSNSGHERYLNPRINELRVPYLDITSNKGHFLRNRLSRRGYPSDYVMKGGIIKSPSASDPAPMSEIDVEEKESEPIVLKVPTLNKVKEAPSEDEFTPNTSQQQFFASRPRHLLGKVSRDKGQPDGSVSEKEMTEEEIERMKLEKRRQIEEELMRELNQQTEQSFSHTNGLETDRLMECDDESKSIGQIDKSEQPEQDKTQIINDRLETIQDESVLITENSIIDCQRMDISEEIDPKKGEEGSPVDAQKTLEDEIEKRFAEIRSNNSRTFWTWERENDNEENQDENENQTNGEDDGRQDIKNDETQADTSNNPVSIIDYQGAKPLVVHPKSEKRLIMPNPEMIKITKKRASDGKSDSKNNMTDVVELAEEEGGIHRLEVPIRFHSELYQTVNSPQALEYLERKLNTIGESEEREENKEESRDYGDKEGRQVNVYLS